MRQGFWPATINVFAQVVARRGSATQGTGDQHSCPLIWFRASAAERPSPGRGELGRSSGDRGQTGPQHLLLRQAGPRHRLGVAGPGTAAPGKSRWTAPRPQPCLSCASQLGAGREHGDGREASRGPGEVGVAGRGQRGVVAAAEEDQRRPAPGHPAVDRGADDDQVITAVGLPEGPANQLAACPAAAARRARRGTRPGRGTARDAGRRTAGPAVPGARPGCSRRSSRPRRIR
jgi:hypothetical protein